MENSFIIELCSFIIEIKVVRNVSLNNIDFHDQPSGCIVLPPEVAKKFQIRKIHKLDKSDRQKYFRFDHRMF